MLLSRSSQNLSGAPAMGPLRVTEITMKTRNLTG
jgi:hypothetical protein